MKQHYIDEKSRHQLHSTRRLLFTRPYLTRRRSKAYWSMGAATFTVFERVSQITYLNLLTSGRLNSYLAEIDKQAEEMFFRLVEQMKPVQGITEQLKAENNLEWVGRLNNIQAYAMEIVNKEIIFA